MCRHGQPLDIRMAALPLLALLGLALIMPSAALAAEPVGRVVARSGGVNAIDEDGDQRRLDMRDPVFAGDTIRTGPRGRAQIRFVDSGMVDLEPRTRLGVDEYRQEQDGGNAVLNFLAGALRAVTGAIGTREDDEYRMNTPVATIGVRGTAYALRICDERCVEQTGGRSGLYGRVNDGSIVVDTPAGPGVFLEGEYFYIPEGGPPQGIVAPPTGILDGGDEAPGGDTGDLPDVGIRPAADDDEGPVRGEAGEDLVDPDFEAGEDTTLEGGGTGINGATAAAAGVDPQSLNSLWAHAAFGDGGAFGTDAQGRVVSGTLDSAGGFGNSFGDPTDVDTSTVTLQESGSVDSVGVEWGRWTGTLTASGPQAGPTPVGGNLAFTITDNLTSPDTLSGLSGTLTYALADGPSAFDQDGDLWTVDALELGVDFGATDLTLVQFDLTENVVQGSSFSFTNTDVANETLDLQNNAFELQMGPSFDLERNVISGKFVGVDAEGAVVVFHARDSDGTQLVTGTKILLAQ